MKKFSTRKKRFSTREKNSRLEKKNLDHFCRLWLVILILFYYFRVTVQRNRLFSPSGDNVTSFMSQKTISTLLISISPKILASSYFLKYISQNSNFGRDTFLRNGLLVVRLISQNCLSCLHSGNAVSFNKGARGTVWYI